MHRKQLRARQRWLYVYFKLSNMHLRAVEKKKKNCAEKALLLVMNKVGINQEKIWTSKIHKISHGS